MRVLWQKLPNGTFAKVASGETWVASFNGKLGAAMAAGAAGALPTNGLLTVDPDYDMETLPEGFDVRYVKSYDTSSGNGQGRSCYIYCDENGSDQNDGLSVEYPVKTLKQAVKTATRMHAVVTVLLAPGTYTINGISSPYSFLGTTNTCRFNAKFGISISALQSTDRPVITGDGIIFWSGYFDFYDLIFQCPLLCNGGTLILQRDDILLPSTCTAERALALYKDSVGAMYNVLIEDNRANNLVNAPVGVSGCSLWYGSGNNAVDSKVVSSNTSRFAISVTNASNLIQYSGKLDISDVNSRPLNVGPGCIFHNNGNAAPAGSYISPDAITY